MILNKVSGGGSKIKINGKPPTEKMDLVEVLGAIKSKGTVPAKIFEVLAETETEYYIATGEKNTNRKFLKGNPYKGWTQIGQIKSEGFYQYTCSAEIDSDGGLIILTTGSELRYEQNLRKYKINNGKVTVMINKNIYNLIGDKRSSEVLFSLNGKVYTITPRLGFFNEEFTQLTSLANSLTGDYKNHYSNLRDTMTTKGFSCGNKRYSLNCDGLLIAFDPAKNSIDLIKDFKRDGYEWLHAVQTAFADANNFYFLATKRYKESNGNYSRNMSAIDIYKFSTSTKTLELKTTIETPYLLGNKRFFVKEVNDNCKIITDSDYTDYITTAKGMVEFPVKTYVNKNEMEV